MHYPLNTLIGNLNGLSEEEINYVLHRKSRVDFTIINKLTKEVVLVIEIDGISSHEQNDKQSYRDKVKDNILKLRYTPLLRLKTNESREAERIQNTLNKSLA